MKTKFEIGQWVYIRESLKIPLTVKVSLRILSILSRLSLQRMKIVEIIPIRCEDNSYGLSGMSENGIDDTNKTMTILSVREKNIFATKEEAISMFIEQFAKQIKEFLDYEEKNT